MQNQQRRLSDKIIAAHKQACDEGKPEVADFLLRALEFELSAIGGDQLEHRRDMPDVEAAFELHEKTFA